MTRELPDTEWESFLTSFTMQHDRWLVTVESLRGADRRIEAENKPLEGITARLGASEPREIVVTVGSHRRFTLDDPVRLRVESQGGVDQALQIEQADGTVTRVAFRSAIAPELVDGLLP